MKAWPALLAVLAASPALATTGVPMGQFGPWHLTTSPYALPPAGQPMKPTPYLATFELEPGDAWGEIPSLIYFHPEGARIITYGGNCRLSERISAVGGRSQDPAVLMEVLIRQARHIDACQSTGGPRDVLERRIRESRRDLERMLRRVRDSSKAMWR